MDDFVIMYKSPTIDAIQRKLQHTINRLEEWTLKNGFTISNNKTVAMHFCPDKKFMDPVLNLDNDPIQFVKEAKFLGLIWDTKLTFEPHIKYLKARCQTSLNILKVLSRTEWGADRTTLLELYRSLVRSKLDYGCIIYGSASREILLVDKVVVKPLESIVMDVRLHRPQGAKIVIQITGVPVRRNVSGALLVEQH